MHSSKKKNSNSYLVMWDMYGLETLLSLNEWDNKRDKWEKDTVWAKLSGKEAPTPVSSLPIKPMILRAQANHQRNYEIYVFSTEDGIDVDEIKTMFTECPQVIVDLIRKNGNKIYSAKSYDDDRVVIR